MSPIPAGLCCLGCDGGGGELPISGLAVVEVASAEYRPFTAFDLTDGGSSTLNVTPLAVTITNPSATNSMQVVARAFSPNLGLQLVDEFDAPVHSVPYSFRRSGRIQETGVFTDYLDGEGVVLESNQDLTTGAPTVGAMTPAYHTLLAPGASTEITFTDTLVVNFLAGTADHIAVSTLSSYAPGSVLLDAIGIIIP